MRILQALSSFFVDILETVTVAFSVWLVLYLFLFQPTQIQGSSMEPNFHNNECILAEKVSYRIGEPQRGDVLPIHAPSQAECPYGPDCMFFKRLIGLPGESIAVHDDHYYINGQELIEPYIPSSTRTLTGPFLENRTVTLGNDEYFVSGDNREHSFDSRYFGPISRADIIGKAIFQYCPAAGFGVLPQAVPVLQ